MKYKTPELPEYFTEALKKTKLSRTDKIYVTMIARSYHKHLDERTAKEIVNGCKKIWEDQSLGPDRIERFYSAVVWRDYMEKYNVPFSLLTEAFLNFHHSDHYGNALLLFFRLYDELKAERGPDFTPKKLMPIFKKLEDYEADEVREMERNGEFD